MKPGNLRVERKVPNPAVVYRKMRVQPTYNAPPSGGAFFAHPNYFSP